MKIKSEDLTVNLKKGLKSIYFVGGDEALLRDEACDQIRHNANQSGFSERCVFHIDSGFDWTRLSMEVDNLSLFTQKKIIELRLGSGKIGDAGSKRLVDYLQNIAPDIMFLIICDKIDGQIQKTKWYTLLDKIGVIVQIWPVSPRQLPLWIAQRMKSKGMTTNEEMVAIIAYRTEGNLLAAAQEVEKLYLTYGTGIISSNEVANAVFDSARFDVFQLVDAVLLGEVRLVRRIIGELRDEGIEAIIIVWALARELRTLVAMSWSVSMRQCTINQAVTNAKVWPKRRAAVSACLHRHHYSQFLGALQALVKIDKMIKGVMQGNIWDELLQLCVQTANP